MWKTFFMSPALGAISALLGWFGALLLKESMTQAEFADLRFGWTGAMVGAVALAAVLLLFLNGDLVEPLVMTVSAAVVAALLWNKRELPFSTQNFREGTSAGYWFTITMMAVVFALLLMSLRAARESNHRARG